MDNSSCPVCTTIAEYVGHWRDGLLSEFIEIKLGAFSGFQSHTQCTACQAVLQHFNAEEHPPKRSCRFLFAKIAQEEKFWIYPDVHCGGKYDEERCDPHGYLELIPSAELSPKGKHFLPIDPRWLDILRVRRWPLYCDAEHRHDCFDLPSWATLNSAPLMILIDVKSQQLVQGIQPGRYVTLSYVWGKVDNVLETTKSNFQELQKPGALESQPWSNRLPKTVHDAILFTKLMDEQYLWVDRLCIIQDDGEHKDKQLKSMASIYSRSYFTIIAADGPDANHGLRGIPGTLSPRIYNLTKLDFSPTCSMIKAPTFETQNNMKEWHRRGWTFQERTLSNRNIVFFQDRIFWECRQSVWTEELADTPDGVTTLGSSQRNFHDRYIFDFLKYPDLHLYSRLVSVYNNRLLTYQTDGLNAFSAIIHSLSRSFPGGFLYGMPEFFFDFAMLWKPIYSQKRRNGPFPSWSWVSWEGNVVVSFLKKSHQLIYNGQNLETPVEISPEVVWYKISERDRHPVRIDNSYKTFQLVQKDRSIPLPNGWSRAKPARSLSTPTSIPDDFYIFKHINVPNVEFLHPIPIATKPFSHEPEPWNNCLHFRAQCCILYLGPVFKGYPQRDGWSNIWNSFVPSCLSVSLVDEAGRWSGIIHSNFSEENEVIFVQECELVIISSGKARRDENDTVKVWLEEWKFIDDIQELDEYEFYNVLWIGRRGNVAYRKALGRVWKTAWQRQPVKEVDIVLS